jgi:AraC-like DNA-binding protein
MCDLYAKYMKYQEAKPCEALRQIVRYFWSIDQENEISVPSRYVLFAESSPSLVFFHTDHSSLLAGQTTSFREMHIVGKFTMVGACLYPYAIPLLFRLPAAELTNAAFDFYAVEGGRESRLLKERVFEADSFIEKIQHLTNYFLNKASRVTVVEKGIQGCVQDIIQRGGQPDVQQITHQLGISIRQAERKFNESVGFSPKLFSRLVRFHSSLKFSGTDHSLTDIAYSSGYFDQSHFIREFRQFSGMSPGRYFRLTPSHLADNFIRLPD